MGKIVAAGAQVNFLRDSGAFADFDFAKTVGVSAVPEAGAVVQGEVPGNFNPGPLMDKRFAFDLRAENIEPEQAPRVGRFRRPATEEKPADFPEQSQGAILKGPGRFLRPGLVGFYWSFRFHGKSLPTQAERQPLMNTDFHRWVDRGSPITDSNESVARSISKR